MSGVSSAQITLIAALTIVCFACSGKTSTETELGAKLQVPVGAYTGCTTSLVEVRPHIEAVSGGGGTVTLSVAGDGRSTRPSRSTNG